MKTFSYIRILTFCTLVLALALRTGASQPQAAPAEYLIDPEHFSIGFLVEHIGYAKILGMFLEAEGSFTFDEERLALTELRVVIQTDSVFTNHKKRDKHLRGVDFLNAREFPEMIFTGASSEEKGERAGTVNGLLTLLGKTLPLDLDVTWNKSGIYPFGHERYTIGISARGEFQRSAYDMNYAVSNGWVGDKIELIIEFEAIRQQ